MDLPQTSRLYSAAIAASKYADQRLEPRTRTDYSGSLRRFADFCRTEGYPNPTLKRFPELPGVMAAYINHLTTSNTSQWPAEKLRAALNWHYKKPEMLVGGHPHDRWVVDTAPDGTLVPRGNPARPSAITQILADPNKSKKRKRTPKRASPMSLQMLTRVIAFLEFNSMCNETMRLWFSAVCSLCFYGMCRINEVLLMKRRDIQLGLQRKSRKNGLMIRFGCFTIRDRKTDHDPLASRTYSLHLLPKEERAAEALTHLSRWFEYARTKLHHNWSEDDYAFPSLTKVSRGSRKRARGDDTTTDARAFANVGIKWGSPMSDSSFTQLLALARMCWETTFGSRLIAQYRFMFAPEKRRWSLKLVKWWAGWAPSEKAETVTRYLLDDVLDREESLLGDSLAPDAIMPTSASLECVRDTDYICPRYDDEELLGAPVETEDSCTAMPASAVDRLKQDLLEGLRDMIKGVVTTSQTIEDVKRNGVGNADPVSDTSLLMSELHGAKSWRDYVTQYWVANPACHQYRAGVDMLSHERKAHRSRLSRMKIIAEFVRGEFQDDLDRFEAEFSCCVNGDMTVNNILAAIRARKKR
ncbi:hypothetical protein L916_05175 [Phytophthora nicotianae]|uniref:Uncharacterized protein n=2 Tax=Phytophthora nicotianae TaxID=4792 RepID=W2JFJ8_PHYNI|nr:hypothetical protein L916_05175 [Phytophthora nicotianae]